MVCSCLGVDGHVLPGGDGGVHAHCRRTNPPRIPHLRGYSEGLYIGGEPVFTRFKHDHQSV